MSAGDRLARLLYVLPRAAQPEGVRIDALCHALDCDPADILRDIEEATARIFYHPAGTVDAFNLSVEDDMVRLYGTEFNRPVRLTKAEAMAVGLGLRVLAAESEVQRREELLALAHRMESELITPDIQLQPMLADRVLRSEVAAYGEREEMEIAFTPDDFRGEIADAIEERRVCDVVYLRAGGTAPAARRIAPVRLVYTRGNWYARAFELESGEVRMFRLDRMLELKLTDDRHEYTDVPAETPTFTTDGGKKVQVRYSRSVARWVAERENRQCEADGTLVITHDVVDMNWLVRHVLQYGGEAVVETPGVREVIARSLGPTLHF